jgi:rubrerythrin
LVRSFIICIMEDSAMNLVPPGSTVALALCVCTLLSSGCSKKPEAQSSPTVTIENLKTAYAKELKYRYMFLQFAQQADREHLAGTARLYRALARSEAIHASNHAVLLRSLGGVPTEPTMDPVVVGKTLQTLKMALSSEGIEAGSFYTNLLKTADAEHASAAVRQFTSVRAADEQHASLLNKAIQNNGVVKATSFLVCPMCGFVMTPEDAKDCADCGVPKASFEII